jgi:DtxR family Mn-dependent transcriptional regulator
MSENVISLSENMQMYLVSILRLSSARQPVPLSKLAEVLDVSPVSVNQMCHKLQDDGLAEYLPYKGVTITLQGAQLASRILRRHRLWEVFLVEHLQMGLQQAHNGACQLEHATSDEVIERLARFLNHPRVNPEGEPIPNGATGSDVMPTRALADMKLGECGHYIQCDAGETCRAFLAAQGLRPGTSFQIIATAAQSVLVESNGRRIVLSGPLASVVRVTVAQKLTGRAGLAPDQTQSQQSGATQ